MEHIIAKTLAAWREAERALEQLPAGSPDRELVAHACEDLRKLHERLVRLSYVSPEQRSESAAQLRDSVAALDRVDRSRLG